MEAEVDLFLPSGSENDGLAQLMNREGEPYVYLTNMFTHTCIADETLRTLFIVSDVVLADEGDLGTGDLTWAFTGSVDIPGSYHFYLLVGLVQTAFHRKGR